MIVDGAVVVGHGSAKAESVIVDGAVVETQAVAHVKVEGSVVEPELK